MRPVRPWQVDPLLRFLATLPLALAAASVLAQLAMRAVGAGPDDRPVWVVAGLTGVLHAVVIVALVPLLRAHQSGWRDAFGFFTGSWMRSWRLALAVTVPGLAGAWLLHQGCGWILDRLAIPHESQTAVDAVREATQPWTRALLFVFAAGTAPLTEELLFRGVLWPFARDRGWRVTGCIGVSFLFALIHFNAAALLPLWLLGILWTWLYEQTGDLTAPILSHTLFNTANFVAILVLGGDAGS